MRLPDFRLGPPSPGRTPRLLAAASGLLLVSVGSRAAAQVAPEEAFEVSWLTAADDEAAQVRVVVTSAREGLTTLDYVVEVLLVDGDADPRISRANGVALPRAGAPDTTAAVGFAITPGLLVQANVRFTSTQEGWTIVDSITRVVGPPRQPQTAIAIDPDFLEVDGLVTDRTLTKSGQDFFQVFYQAWQPPLGARSYALLVEEVPFRGRQTLIQVSLNDEEPFYQQVLQPRYDVVEEMALQAVEYAVYTLQLHMQAQQNTDGEFGEPIESY